MSGIKLFFLFVLPFVLQSCFFIKLPVQVTHDPIQDTVNVYHVIVSRNSKQIADTLTCTNFKRESSKAFHWISREAARNNQNLVFRDYWLNNKDTSLKETFIHKLPARSIDVLTRKSYFKIITRKRKKGEKEKTELVNWRAALFDSISRQIKDTAIARKFGRNENKSYYRPTDQLIMVHLLKVRKSKVLGFYNGGEAFIGSNKSETIAHESIHHLGAPDLYTHLFWFGKRRRIVKKEMKQEIMNGAIAKNYDCNTYYLGNYTAYTIGWVKEIQPEYKPILKENLMAKCVLFVMLLF